MIAPWSLVLLLKQVAVDCKLGITSILSLHTDNSDLHSLSAETESALLTVYIRVQNKDHVSERALYSNSCAGFHALDVAAYVCNIFLRRVDLLVLSFLA